ncbi:MAG TPA: ABC transporter permease [Nevskiaceae bacterium]|nr:ABC transporter permease [Nevskiaceae bacterium]
MNTPVRRELRGGLGSIRNRRVIGWVCIEGEGPLTVEVSINQKPVATGLANLMRPDIQAKGFHPTGECGYDITLPPEVVLAEGDVVECTVEGAEGQWNRNPAWIRLNAEGKVTLEPLPRKEPSSQAEPEEGDDVLPVFGVIPVRPRWQVVVTTMRALLLREIRNRYGAFRFGYFWAVAQPVLFIAILQAARYAFRGRGGFDLYGVNGFYFFQLGVIPWFMFSHGYHQSMGAMRAGKGIYSYRQVQPIDMILIRNTIEFVLMIATFGTFLLVFEWIGWPVSYADPVAFLAMLVLLFLFTISLGIIADVAITKNEDMRRIFTLIDRPLFLMSGVFFTLEAMPEATHKYLLWNPLLHALELGRASMLEHYETPCSWWYLTICTVVLMMFAMGLYRRNLWRLNS